MLGHMENGRGKDLNFHPSILGNDLCLNGNNEFVRDGAIMTSFSPVTKRKSHLTRKLSTRTLHMGEDKLKQPENQ